MRKLLTILSIAFVAISFVACNSDVSVTGVTLNPTAASITIGDSLQLTATVAPSDAADPAITWSSSHPAYATVDNGLVRAIAEGETTITVTTRDGNYTANSVVTVGPVVVTGITLPQTTAWLISDSEFTIEPTILPVNATNQAFVWTSSDENIIRIDQGYITLRGYGTTTLRATTVDGGFYATIDVSIFPEHCNRHALTFELGIPYFATDLTWTIEGTGDRPTQIWSDAVRAPGCNKSDFNGGSIAPTLNFNADCRSNPNGFNGHLISWCLMMRFANEFCPYPWRVPSREDFEILHQNLGHELPTSFTTAVLLIPDSYIGTTGTVQEAGIHGGRWGGTRFTGTALFPQGDAPVGGTQQSNYWSSTMYSITMAHRLLFDATMVSPQHRMTKLNGYAVRCVRNQ